MHHASDQDPDDPYLVSSRLEIVSLLRTIERRKVLTRMFVPDRQLSVITTLLHVDMDRDVLLFDNASDTLDNQRLLEADAVAFEATVDKVRIHFDAGRPSVSTFEGLPALQLALPQTLRRIQRRDSHRVEPPITDNVLCTVMPIAQPGSSPHKTLPVFDLSTGGLSLLDDGDLVSQLAVGASFQPCTLTLPQGPVQDLVLQVRRITEALASGTRPRFHIGCEFQNLSNAKAIRIQQYLVQVERRQIARARGLE